MKQIHTFNIALVARFGAAGIFSTLVHMLVVWMAARGLGWPLTVANAIAYVVANFSSWLLQSRWTFQDHPKSLRRWFAASAGLFVVSGISGQVVDVTLPGAAYGWVVAVLPIIALSFFLMRYWVFSQDAA